MDVLHLPDPADQARALLGDETFAKASGEGRHLTLAEAVDLAMRPRPSGPVVSRAGGEAN
jgi:hypothetical protein